MFTFAVTVTHYITDICQLPPRSLDAMTLMWCTTQGTACIEAMLFAFHRFHQVATASTSVRDLHLSRDDNGQPTAFYRGELTFTDPIQMKYLKIFHGSLSALPSQIFITCNFKITNSSVIYNSIKCMAKDATLYGHVYSY